MYHKHAIETWPLQTYASALLFSPTQSSIRRIFQNDMPSWVTTVPDMEPQWTSCLQVLEGHTEQIISIMFSKDSSLLLTTSWYRTMIFETASGRCMHIIEHVDLTVASTFSHDSSKIAIVLSNCQVHLWNTTDGAHFSTLVWPGYFETSGGHTSFVAFSRDSSFVATSYDTHIAIWNTGTSECVQMIKTYNHEIISIAFTLDSKHLLLAANSGTIEVWDVRSGDCLKTCGGGQRLNRGIFSKDTKQFISSSPAGAFRHDTISGECHRLLDDSPLALAISPDATKYASDNGYDRVSIWKSNSNIELHTLECRTGFVSSIAFSHDSKWIASGATSGEVKIWDLSAVKPSSTHPQFGRDQAASLHLSPDASHLVMLSNNPSMDIWDASSGRHSILEGHSAEVQCLVFSPNQLTRLASGSFDKTIKLWNSSTGMCEQTLVGHEVPVCTIAFSHESTQLVSMSVDGTIKLWDLETSSCIRTFVFSIEKKPTSSPTLAVFSPDSKKLAMALGTHRVRLWDLNEDVHLRNFFSLPGSYEHATSLAFSYDSRLLAAASSTGFVKIWDAGNGECILRVRCDRVPSRISFDSTGQYLNTGSATIDINASFAQPSDSLTLSLIYHGLSIHSSNSLITHNSRMVLWLPSEYRTLYDSSDFGDRALYDCSDVLGDTVAIVDSSRRLWMYKFDLDQIQALELGKQRPVEGFPTRIEE